MNKVKQDNVTNVMAEKEHDETQKVYLNWWLKRFGGVSGQQQPRIQNANSQSKKIMVDSLLAFI